MKTVSVGSLLLGLLVVAAPATLGVAADSSGVKLIDMYARAEGDDYRIYIMASGDISQYKSSRKLRADSYKLILDVPALPPIDSKYDLTTPFSKRFEVWPMKLGDQIYSRIAMELDIEASSVIGLASPARIFITISRKSETAVADASVDRPMVEEAETGPEPTAEDPMPTDSPLVSSDPIPTLQATEPDITQPEIPMEEQPQGDMQSIPMETDPSPLFAGEIGDSEPQELAIGPAADSADTSIDSLAGNSEQFFSLFPVPASERRIIMDLGVNETEAASFDGIRLGRFLMRPVVLGSFMKGSNVLLLNENQYRDSVLHVRVRTVFDLLESENTLRLAYELRYQQYGKFKLIENFSHFFNFESNIHLTPTTLLDLQNHLVKGSYESREFDPGGELAFSFDPFIRNLSRAALRKDMSERMGFEIYGSYNHVHFTEVARQFFDYNTTVTGASFLYNLSPLTNLFGSYEHLKIPRPTARPQAQSSADSLYMGIKGELSPLLVGQARVGFRDQEFGQQDGRQSYRGLVADVNLTRYFGETTALEAQAGRMTSPSNYEQNGYFVSNYLNLRFAFPLVRNLRMNTGASLFNNSYSLPSIGTGTLREDRSTTGWLGASYYFSRRGFFEFTYRHERRNSKLDQYNYRNNVIMFLVGFGYL
jgi:hypothetical protein